jgi:hypothetical protein
MISTKSGNHRTMVSDLKERAKIVDNRDSSSDNSVQKPK